MKELHSYAERTYIRLETGDRLMRCLEEADSHPVESWVESLVVEGPKNLGILREILAEVLSRKTNSGDSLSQMYHDLEDNLKSFGVSLEGLEKENTFLKLTPARFMRMVREQGIVDPEDQASCLRLMNQMYEPLQGLGLQMRIFKELEIYLMDWIWGLVHQSTHDGNQGSKKPQRLMH